MSGYNIGSEGSPGAEKAHLHGMTGVGGTRSNQIQYISPNFGSGFTVRAQYGAGTGRESIESTVPGTNGLTTDKTRRMALMLRYANGTLSLAAAYTNLRSTQANINPATNLQLANGATTSVFGVTGAAPGATAATLSGAARTGNLFQLGGSYDFGVAKIAGTFNRGKNGGLATSPAGTPNGTPGFNYSYRAFQVGVSVPVGVFVPFAIIGRARTDSSNPAGASPTLIAAATNRIEDYRSYQFGARYSLSKRTTAYLFFDETRNEAAALAGSTSFYKVRKTVAGLMHTF